MKGTFSKAPNFEFAEMAYGGMLSIFYQRGDSGSFNKKKVVAAFKALQKKHPLLARYELPKLTYALVKYHFVQRDQKYIGTNDNNWKNNALFAMDDTTTPRLIFKMGFFYVTSSPEVIGVSILDE
jgi:hypothetical protein